jgi:hypothetical protein
VAEYAPRLNENVIPTSMLPHRPIATVEAEPEVVPARVIRAPERPSDAQEAPEGVQEAAEAPEGTQEAQEGPQGVSMVYRQEDGEHLIYVEGPSLMDVASWEVKQAAYAMRVGLGLGEAGIDLKHHAHIVQPDETPAADFQNPSGMVARLVYRLSGMPHGAAGTPILGSV